MVPDVVSQEEKIMKSATLRLFGSGNSIVVKSPNWKYFIKRGML